MGFSSLQPANLTDLDAVAFKNGEFQILPAEFWKQYSQNHIALFCLMHGMYCIPTTELIEWLQHRIGDRKALEVGAGSGVVGRAVGIRMTDNYQQASLNAHTAKLHWTVLLIQYSSTEIS